MAYAQTGVRGCNKNTYDRLKPQVTYEVVYAIDPHENDTYSHYAKIFLQLLHHQNYLMQHLLIFVGS